MKEYSVLLLYPDYLADDPSETFYEHVTATSPKNAGLVAQQSAISANAMDEDTDPDDFAVLLILEGHHHGVDPEATE